MKSLSIELLAEKLGGKLWSKGEMKRIYLDEGYNTKKMSTKTYVYQRQDGTFGVICNVDCPSQPHQWEESKEKEIEDRVYAQIEQAVWENDNPGADYDEFIESENERKEEEAETLVLTELQQKKQKIANLNISTVGEFLKGISEEERYNFKSTIWNIKFEYGQLLTQSRFLNEKDEYPAMIYENGFERTFLRNEKSADESWMEPVGNIKVGTATLYFPDEVEFSFLRKQGKNGPNKKNVFAPKSIPAHITEKLNQVLEEEKNKRIEDLKSQVAHYTQKLTSLIEHYKSEQL